MLAEHAPLLAVEDLRIEYPGDAGAPIAAVDGLSFTVERGELLGLAGESGSGKSTLARGLLRLLPPAAAIRAGRVFFEGRDVLAMSEAELRAWRWRRVSMVPQDAMNALNPLLTVADQVGDAIVAHEQASRRTARARVAELLDLVGVSRSRLDGYPHELSGGMRQRVVIAMALALRPDLVILDEPTTALDVLVKNEILAHLAVLRRTLGFSAVLIGHDLPAMFDLCARVGVLQAGRLVELGPAARLRAGGEHPYTQRLVRCLLDPRRPRARVTP
jgi:peptide/nickel transport system ATP-binding protein